MTSSQSHIKFSLNTISKAMSLKQRQKDDSEIEETDESIEEHISEPFDPTKIDITTKSLNIDLLVKRLRSEPSRIDLKTAFQRGSDLWTVEKQSRLIESMMIRLPLPVFYFDAANDNKWEVVDGLQRLSTLFNFIVKEKFLLKGLEYLEEYEGKAFKELPEYMKTRIEETEVTVYLINAGTPINVKYNIFKRINTSGLVLTPQEIRHAIHQGIPASFVQELAESNHFIKATSGAVKPKRMDDRDFVTRFIAFFLTPYQDYKPDLDNFLNSNMAKLGKITTEERNTIRQAFIKSMTAAELIFKNDAFRKRYDEFEKDRSLINKALFEAWSVNLAKLPKKDLEKLIGKAALVRKGFVELMHNEEFDSSISRSTGSLGAVQTRFKYIGNLIENILNVN